MTVAAALDRYFGITEKGSSIRTEVKGGILVFLAMSYIIVVNTGMMVDAGIDHDAAFSATIVMSIIGSVIMGLYAKFPVAMAPGMGINAMFCYTAVLGLGFSWQTALVAIFISGLLFFIITATGVRQRVLDRIPHGIKSGITAGIGCFIAFIGLQNAGIIANSDTTLVTIGDLADPAVLLGVFCLLVTILLVARRVSAGVLIAMILTAVVGMAVGIIQVPDAIFSVPSAPPIGEFVNGLDSSMLSVEFVMIVVAFAMVEFFDGSGTLMAVGKRAGFVDDQGNVTCDRALNVDAGIAAFSGVVGCTPTTAFAESAVGVEAGARTGLAPIVVALLFGLALFIAPLFGVVDYSCTVGAMVIVGAAMITELRGTDWDDLPTSLTILVTVLTMVLTYSITDGIALGIIVYCVSMIGARRYREVHWVLYLLAVIFAVYLVAYALSF